MSFPKQSLIRSSSQAFADTAGSGRAGAQSLPSPALPVHAPGALAAFNLLRRSEALLQAHEQPHAGPCSSRVGGFGGRGSAGAWVLVLSPPLPTGMLVGHLPNPPSWQDGGLITHQAQSEAPFSAVAVGLGADERPWRRGVALEPVLSATPGSRSIRSLSETVHERALKAVVSVTERSSKPLCSCGLRVISRDRGQQTGGTLLMNTADSQLTGTQGPAELSSNRKTSKTVCVKWAGGSPRPAPPK